jgi:hypothetical protein
MRLGPISSLIQPCYAANRVFGSRFNRASQVLVLRLVIGTVGVIALVVSAACSTESRLRVTGETPYVRCLAAPPPKEHAWRVGALGLRITKRVLHVESASGPTLAVLSGPAFGRPWSGADLAALTSSSATLVVVLGGLGETEADAATNLQTLAATGRVSLVLGGGRDRFGVTSAAFDRLDGKLAERVVDIRALDEVQVGSVSLVPVAGGELGHYASTDDACGFAKDDLDALADRLGRRDGRWLLSWQAPAGPFARDDQGLELGSVTLAAFAQQVGADAGLHAYPEAQAGRVLLAAPRHAVVPRLAGARPERSDGSLVPTGFALVDLANAAISWVPAMAPENAAPASGSVR